MNERTTSLIRRHDLALLAAETIQPDLVETALRELFQQENIAQDGDTMQLLGCMIDPDVGCAEFELAFYAWQTAGETLRGTSEALSGSLRAAESIEHRLPHGSCICFRQLRSVLSRRLPSPESRGTMMFIRAMVDLNRSAFTVADLTAAATLGNPPALREAELAMTDYLAPRLGGVPLLRAETDAAAPALLLRLREVRLELELPPLLVFELDESRATPAMREGLDLRLALLAPRTAFRCGGFSLSGLKLEGRTLLAEF